MNTVHGILFDKDGTLFHYGRVWGPIGHRYLMKSLRIFGRLTEEKRTDLALRLEKLLGVDRDGNSYTEGVLYDNSRIRGALFRTIGCAMRYMISPVKLIKILSDGMDELHKNLETDLKDIDFSEAQEVFRTLHDRGFKLGIVTSDNLKSTSAFIKMMGIDKWTDFVRTSDHPWCRPKPAPDAIDQFCAEFSLKPEDLCMVGDTVGDMVFGENGKVGYRIAVLTGSNDVEGLKKHSDVIYDSVGGLLGDPVLFPRG